MATSWGYGKITERDLKTVAAQVAQGLVERRDTEDVAKVTRFRWQGDQRQPMEQVFICTAKVRILQERGYAERVDGAKWSLTSAGDEWLAGFRTGPPVTTRMKEGT